MAHRAAMTDIDRMSEQRPALVDPAPRSGKAWTEEDYLDLLSACRSGCGLVEIAQRVGRTLQSVQSQLRRLLPADERHLPLDLALPRLRQLDSAGDYDWLGALAKRTPSPWGSQPSATAGAGARGVGGLTDDELLHLALSTLTYADDSSGVARQIARELRRRGLASQLEHRAAADCRAALERLLEPDWSYGGYDMPADPLGWPM
jgi:hypothetical protein